MLTAGWTYDNEGHMTDVIYPSWKGCSTCSIVSGSHYTFAYDNMGRMNTMTDTVNTRTLVSGMTYGVANEVQQMTSGYTTGVNSETRTYNSMFQLTQLQVGSSALNIQYAYSATQNNGKITSQSDVISGEQIAYTYDALNRLASAQTTQTGGTQWGQSYTYDGFGNLTDQTVIKGSAPDVHVAYNASNNRQTGDTADANGNIGSGYIYDMDNRLVQPGSSSTAHYGYDAGNKRVWRGDTGTGMDEIAFWAGQKLATYQVSTDSSGVYFTLTSTNVYFGGKLISKGTYNSFGTGDCVNLTPVVADRLGSIGKFYPYGTERPSATGNDKEKFTGYFRDASTGLDYADQRYEQPGGGRFMTPDSAPSAKLTDPGSWNKYAYTGGDPINRADPTGRDWYDLYSYYSYTADSSSYYLAAEMDAEAAWGYYLMVQGVTDRYNNEVSQLQPLQDSGLIGGYSVDFWSGQTTFDVNWDVVYGLLGETPTAPQIVSTWDILLTALKSNPLLATLGLFLMQQGDGHRRVYRSPADIETNCTKVGGIRWMYHLPISATQVEGVGSRNMIVGPTVIGPYSDFTTRTVTRSTSIHVPAVQNMDQINRVESRLLEMLVLNEIGDDYEHFVRINRGVLTMTKRMRLTVTAKPYMDKVATPRNISRKWPRRDPLRAAPRAHQGR